MKKEIVYIRGYWQVNDLENIEADYIEAQDEFQDKYRFDGAVIIDENGFFKGVVTDMLKEDQPQVVIGKMAADHDKPTVVLNKIGGPSPIVYEYDIADPTTMIGTYNHHEDGILYPSDAHAMLLFITEPKKKETYDSIEDKYKEIVRLGRPDLIDLVNELTKDPYYLYSLPRREDEYTLG